MNKKSWAYFISAILLLTLSVVAVGCTPPRDKTLKKPGDYFPLTKGSYWEYEGEGNEFAGFTREVLYTKENRAQTREDTGGTVGTAVFKTTGNAVTRIFFMGESFEDKNLIDVKPKEEVIIIKTPIRLGNVWDEPKGTREIVAIKATIETPAGIFEDCLGIKITYQGSTMYEYYKAGVGLIKREFVAGETGDRVTSTLKKYSIKK